MLILNYCGGQRFLASTSISTYLIRQRSHTPNTNLPKHTTSSAPTVGRGRQIRRRQKGYNNIARSPTNILTSIRKTGSKKGVLEFEVDNVAMEALKKATTDYVNPKLLEWQIDKFLTLANKEYESDLLLTPTVNVPTPPKDQEEIADDKEDDDEQSRDDTIGDIKPQINDTPILNDIDLCTPPATEYFSSDFDLCDLINQSSERLQEEADDAHRYDRNTKTFSIFNSVHMNKYYRKRKNPKTNRTGWPKTIKKKTVTRQQSMQDKIYFMQNGNTQESDGKNQISIKQEVVEDSIPIDEDDTTQEQTRESGVITPPDSDNELNDNDGKRRSKHNKITNGDAYEESLLMDEDSQIGLNEDSQTANDEEDEDDEDEEDEVEEREEDNETLADSIEDEEEEEEQRQQKLDSDGDADADIEEADEDERSAEVEQKSLEYNNKKLNKKCKKVIPKIIENDDEDSYEPQEKRTRCLPDSPEEKIRTNLLNPNTAHTSTPTTPFMRALRRTPQLNGSLGSCISPSEKAGDNSDIFTVSSDGLDTDMDLSNSHTQMRTNNTNASLDEDEHHQHHHHNHHNSLHNNSSNTAVTPKRKFDISKYAPTNAATCAAEAATAAVKSLAISQFLKKEVRVTCRRLRAPFRRFRYRR